MAKILLNVELNTGNAQKQIKSLQSTFELMAKSLNSVSVNKNLTAQMNSAARYYNAIAKAAKFATDATEKRRLVESKIATQEAKTSTELAKKANLLDQIKVRNERLANSQKKLTEVEKENTEEVKKNNIAIDKKSQSIKSMLPNILKWQVAMTAVMLPLRLIRQALQFVVETLISVENKVIEIRRVLQEDISKKTISSDLLHISQELGQSFENVSEIATNFARTGLSWNETLDATRAAVLALNVAELDATQASDGLLSIMTQFGYRASDLTEIVARLNIVADRNPVTTEKLLTALQRTGSAAKNARMELGETIGVITALSKATNRSGANLGTAANALIQYSTKSSALDIFSKVSQGSAAAVDKYKTGQGNILDVWREVASAIGSSESRQQDLLSQLKDNLGNEDLSQDVQDELSDIFEQMQEVYGTANTFRKNYFIALLDNIDTVDKAIEEQGDSIDHLMEENNERMQSFVAKVEQLKSLFQEIANDESGILGLLKNLIDGLRVVTEITAVVSNWTSKSDEEGGNWWARFGGNILKGHGLVGSFVLASSEKARNLESNGLGQLADNIHEWRVGEKEDQEDITNETEKTAEATEKWGKSLYSVMNDYEDIAKRLKEIREEQQKTLDIEERKKALEDAIKNKNVRVLNAATGIWEWQANEKDVQTARENLEDAFFKVVDSKLKEGNNTAANILNYIEEYFPLIPEAVETVRKVLAGAGYNSGTTAPRWTSYEQAAKYLNVQTSAEWSRRNSSKSYQEYLDEEYAKYYGYKPTYDSGGILSGLGGIKATSRPETVLPPDLTEKILTPSSNEDFARFAKSLGIIFGTSREVAKSEIIHNNGGNTTNSDNRSYMVNGVPFTQQDADSKTLTELFADAAYFNN